MYAQRIGRARLHSSHVLPVSISVQKLRRAICVCCLILLAESAWSYIVAMELACTVLLYRVMIAPTLHSLRAFHPAFSGEARPHTVIGMPAGRHRVALELFETFRQHGRAVRAVRQLV